MKGLLESYGEHEGVTLLTNPFNLGFVGSVNRALLTIPQGDILLLNADAILPPGAIERLRRTAHSIKDIGTVTHFPTTENSRAFRSRSVRLLVPTMERSRLSMPPPNALTIARLSIYPTGLVSVSTSRMHAGRQSGCSTMPISSTAILRR